MSEGPTTVGSIVGKLRVDASDWDAELTKAGVKADELGRNNPNIKVDADVAAALAKLEQVRAAAELAGANTTSSVTVSTPGNGSVTAGAAAKVDAVAAAERRLAAAESASEMATARAIVAEMRFEEQRDKRKQTAAQVAVAELAVSEAVKRSEAAAMRAIAAEEALAAAQRKAAESALAQAAAQETATAATVKANEANSTNVSRTGLIVAAVAALVPMMVPLAAFTIGAAGALTMMGVSGVIAVKGIHDEMAAGTAVGAEYRTGLQGMKGDLDVLAHTGAVAMLSSFKTTTGALNDSMPMLNRQVGAFTGFLGRSGANVFAGSLQGARVLEPLMMSISGWVEHLSAGFKSWTENGGLQAFANYAIGSLPQVEATLAAVATAIMHILEALAPLGSVGLSVLTGISGAINGLPVQVLGDLIAAVIAGWGAFKLWGFVAPILATVAESIGAVGVATQIATGPIGWITAGISALVAVVAVSVVSTQQATAVTESYTAALKADSGAIGENVRQQAIQQLMASGSIAAGKELGISAKVMTDATLGNTAALATVHTAVSTATAKYKDLTNVQNVNGQANGDATRKAVSQKDAIDNVSGALKLNGSALQQSIRDQKLTDEANGVTTASTDAQGASVKELARRYGMTTSAYLAAIGSQQQTADQLTTTTQAMFIQNDAAGLLKQSLDLLNGKTLSAAQAQNQFDSQIANMSDHMNAAGNQVDRANAKLDGMSAAAVKNRGELIGLTSAAEANAQAFRDNGGSAEDTKQKLIDMKKSIVDNAVAHGENRAEVQKYIDKIFQIPDKIPPTKLEVDAAVALQKLKDLKALLDGIQRVVNVRVNTILTGATNPNRTFGLGDGGINIDKPRKADGGTVLGLGSAASDTAGLFRLANGEEVISNMRGQADRYRPLLKAINAGVTLPAISHVSPSRMPDVAGAAQSGHTRGDSNVHVTFVNPVSRNPVEDARVAGQLLNASINV